jgi:hypothetical protein
MKGFFKKYFVPHSGNDHRPHLLRIQTLLILLSMLLLLEIIFFLQVVFLSRSTNFLALVLPDVLVDETNAARLEAKVGTLTVNPLLTEAARLKAEDMAANSYFAHVSPDGKSPWYWLGQAGYSFGAAGENLAVNFADSKDVLHAWLNSPGHRTNLLNQTFTEIGIATARGMYKSKEALFVVQFFGKPKAVSVVIAPTPVPVFNPEPVSPQEMAIEITPSPETDVLSETVTVPTVAPAVPQSTFTERVVARPRLFNAFVLIFLSTIVALALILKIFLHFRPEHSSLVVHGVVFLLLIASAFVVNHYIAQTGSAIF